MISYEDYISHVKCLNNWTKAYDEGKPVVSDKQWDDWYFEIQEYEYNYPDCIWEESPTQKIHFEEVSELKKVKHNHPMLSLNKTKDIDEIKNFIGNDYVIAMAKMDGLTCSLHYEGGKLVSAETRGNGIEGEDITHNALVIPSIPNKINYKEPLTIDGEIICTYADFHNWSKEYKNPRNFASGSIRLLDSKECRERDLTFIAWDIIEDVKDYNFNFLSEKLIFLKYLTFEVVPFTCVNCPQVDSDYNLDTIIDELKENSSAYPIDGLVFKYNKIDVYNAAGRTEHHFKGGLAYKFYDEEYETKLKYIDYDVSRNGILTPVAVFEPIDIDGSTVSRASLHNMSVMYDTLGDDPYIGEPIWIIKANQIIPQVVRADKRDYGYIVSHGGATCDRNGVDGFFICPVCGGVADIEKSDSGVKVLKCQNPECSGRLTQQIDHFCGKKGLDIKGLSLKTLEKLINWGWLEGITDIPKLKKHRDEWIKKPGFGEASVDKILKSIDDRLAEAPLQAFISGLGIPLVGSRISKQICEEVETWKDYRDLINSHYDFTEWDGFGYEINAALHNFDYSEADKLVDYLTFKPSEHLDKTAKLDGKTFVITGKLINFKNRQELANLIETNGGKVQSSVSVKTSYLINNDSTSAKNKKAKELNIPVITEERLLEIINE